MTELVTKLDLETALDRLALRLTVRLGIMLLASSAMFLGILRLTYDAYFLASRRVLAENPRKSRRIRRWKSSLWVRVSPPNCAA